MASVEGQIGVNVRTAAGGSVTVVTLGMGGVVRIQRVLASCSDLADPTGEHVGRREQCQPLVRAVVVVRHERAHSIARVLDVGEPSGILPEHSRSVLAAAITSEGETNLMTQ